MKDEYISRNEVKALFIRLIAGLFAIIFLASIVALTYAKPIHLSTASGLELVGFFSLMFLTSALAVTAMTYKGE